MRVVRDLINDVRQVREEVTLVLVREDGGGAGAVELDVLVGDTDEVDGGVCSDEGFEGLGDDLGYFAL